VGFFCRARASHHPFFVVSFLPRIPVMPFRLLLFLGGTARWSKKLIGIVKKKMPKAKKPSEVENFLARAPTSTSLTPLKFHLVKKLRHS
jgi:hypothetical protein